MKALILFGSESDCAVYNGVIDSLGESAETIFEVISAHRQPERLHQALSEYQYDFVVAGAGLAAHLPGVVASLTTKPVFGIPVAANFAGLDAFLAIVQMPKGVPVLSCHPENYWEIAGFVHAVNNCKPGVVNVVSQNISLHGTLIEAAFDKNRDVSFSVTQRVDEDIVNIILVENKEQIIKCSNAIHLPIYSGEDKNAITKAFEFFSYSENGGLWVGANNIINAVLFYKKMWGVFS